MQERLIPSARARFAVLALVLATAISHGLLFARAAVAGQLKLGFLPWNLFLAWIPLIFALKVYRLRLAQPHRRGLLLACAAMWFFFYPNAPYIVTDLVHWKTRDPIPRWFDLLLLMSFAWTGLFLGYFSLYLMQEVVRAWRGRRWSWAFATVMLALGSIGIYLGRFLRWNSWDVLRPWYLISDAVRKFHELTEPESAAFALTFFAFALLTYVTLYTMTHLHGHTDRLSDITPDKSRLPSHPL